MNADPKWYVLAVLVLLLLAIVIPSAVNLREYSDQEVREVCLEIYEQYKSMNESSASTAEWQDFEESALAKLGSVAADIESVSSEDSPGAWRFYQAAKYDIPEIIRSRNDAVRAHRVEAALAVPLSSPGALLGISSRPADLGTGTAAESKWDPVVVALVVLDTIALVGGVVYWLRGRG